MSTRRLDLTLARGEMVANYLAAVGIKVRLRTMERAAHMAARNAKQLRGLCTCGSGRYGNAATRLEEVAVSTGVFAYGGYPDIDELFKQQDVETDQSKREALLHNLVVGDVLLVVELDKRKACPLPKRRGPVHQRHRDDQQRRADSGLP